MEELGHDGLNSTQRWTQMTNSHEIDPFFKFNIILTPKEMINQLAQEVHHSNKNWWIDLDTGEPLKRNMGELLMLCVSELSEAMEGHRKNLMDDKLPHRKMIEVELADALIRILDIASGFHMDLGGAYEEKMAFNAFRKDHTLEARRQENGKKY